MSDQLQEYGLAVFLGKGVDLFDVDPWSPPSKDRVIDDSADIDIAPIGATGLTNIYSENYLDLKHQIGVELGLKGSYEGFSGKIDAKYNYNDELKQDLKFAKISFLITGNTISLRDGRDGLKRSLTQTFSEALTTASPDDLFRTYGTHITTTINTGGKAEYFARSSETTTISHDDFMVDAQAKYEALGGSIEGTAKVTGQGDSTRKDVIGSSSIATLGGDAHLAANITKDAGWTEWAESCEKSPAFLSFGEDGLVPVWELTDDPKRQTELRDAYRRRAAKTLRTHIVYFTSDPASHPDARITVPDGYKLLLGGALDDWSEPGNLLTASFPESDSTWRASGKDHLGVSPAKITAYAIVTYDPDDIWDIKQSSITSVQAGHPSQDISVQGQDWQGYTMIGGGAQVNWSGAGNLLTASYPRDGITWSCAAKDHLAASSATITAYVIGLKCKVDGLKVLQNIQKSSSSPEDHPTASVSPSAGYVVVGGGARVNYSGAGNMLTASYPRDKQTWEARSKDHAQSDPATLDVYAIGLKVVDA
jgi:hypothetical protein